jgi:superfamily I DNA and RNA helicase
MLFDIVRGKITKPEQSKQLIDVVKKYMDDHDETGTLYLGYPLTANADEAVTVEALWVTESKGMIAFVFGNAKDSIEQLKEQQDSLYYNIDFYLKKYSTLRKGRNLAFTPLVVTVLPNKVEYADENNEYLFCTCSEIPLHVKEFNGFDKEIYKRLCEVLQKVSEIKPRKKRANVKKTGSYGDIIKRIEKEIANLDQWQKKAAFEVPDGPQRIKGLAGSGKTIVLALKAAYLHTQYPELKIGVTYYTRALYQQYVNLITDFVQDMSGEKVDWDNLDIIHAWGSNSEQGIYSNMAKKINFKAYNLTSAISKFGRNTPFKGCCDELLSVIGEDYEPEYDVILIDEAQDLPSSFFRLVYANVKAPKRIIWAYDELQNLSTVEMPSLVEMFGVDENGNLNINIENKEDEPKRDITLPVCYRNPPWTLALAHALGFGIYHKPIIQMFDDPEIWEDIGYTVKNGKLKENNSVRLSRKNISTPKYFEELLGKNDSIKVKGFATVDTQYSWIAQEIRNNIEQNELDPDDILIVLPDTYYAKSQYKELEKFLKANGIKSILAGVDTDRDTFRVSGCVTCAHVYRAKGNEAPMVYVVNAEYCADGMELIKLRNILFTSITRSRAWVRICGVGEKMDQIQKEYNNCMSNDYDLCFRIPTAEELRTARRVNRERTMTEKRLLEDTKSNINELITNLEKGTVDSELLPELNKLIDLLGKR